MRIRKGQRYAVLTGDIVQSRRLSVEERRALGRTLDRIGRELAKWPAVPLPPGRHRGDGWQLLVSRPPDALRVGLFVRASLRSGFEGRRLDTRVAIGVGTVDFVPGERVAEGDGEAYRRSGAALEAKGGRRFRFSDAEPGDADVQTVLGLVDFVAQEWTPAQATAVVGALRGWTQERIAEKWPGEPITQQGVAHHLRRAGWDAVEAALSWFSERIQP